jgi:RTX calcium-binding nonapeptide repeat (4 copies)
MRFEECDPNYSPDGTKVVYAVTNPIDVWIMNSDGSGQTNLTTTGSPVGEAGPSWQPIQTCGKSAATIVGDDGPDVLKGTKRRDVFVANAGNDVVKGKGGQRPDLPRQGQGQDDRRQGPRQVRRRPRS